MKKLLITGSSGLIGSEVCLYFANQGWAIHGIDNNRIAIFFGSQQKRLETQIKGFVHHEIDVRDRPGILNLIDIGERCVIADLTDIRTTNSHSIMMC